MKGWMKRGGQDPKIPAWLRFVRRIVKPTTIKSILKSMFLVKRGNMKLLGTLNLKGPQFERKGIELDISGEEFVLQTDKEAKEAIGKFSLHISMDEDKEVKIANDIEAGDIVYDFLPLTIYGDGGNSVGFTISPEQAMALKETLERYLEFYQAIKALNTDRIIKQA